ncbi:MAG: amino acid adenylation domain-containing protein [Leptolyngbya sp. SIOISBB]|nr:amino acid adenylation domain-containing protein [Leptolyngbya sp. SIOISBB]
MVLSPNPSPLNANYVAVDFDPFAEGELVNTAAATESQREIWASVQMGDEANCAYNESQNLTLQGQLDVDALKAALQSLVDRHEALRTTLSPDGTTLCTQVNQALIVPVQDWSDLSSTERQTKLDDCLYAAVSTPFDLEHGPLFRVEILRLEPTLHQVILTAHHIICDGWSWGVMLPELGQLYSALTQGQPAKLPEPEPFSQYALQLEAAVQNAETAAIEQYWLDQFANSVPVVDFPTDVPRPPLRTFNSAREDWVLEGELVSQLKQLGKTHGCSFMTTLLAGFEIFLHRLTGQADLTVGISAAGQAAEGLHHLVGHCVNLLPLHTQVDAQQSFQTYLQQRRSALLDAYDHQQFTFGSLVKRLALPRDASRIPLVPITFNLDQALDPQQLCFEGLDAALASNPRPFENFEIFINATEAQGQLTLECQYNTNLFRQETIQRRLAELETLLRGVVQNPQQAIAHLPLLPEPERALLASWNQTQASLETAAPMHQRFEQWAAQTPAAIAVEFEGQTLTYEELNQRANQLAHHLQQMGVGPNTLVGLHLERSLDLTVALLGILKAGGAYVPLDPAYPADRLRFMVDDAQLAGLLTQASLLATAPTTTARVICVDQDWPMVSQQPTTNLSLELDGSALAYVIYTSGSTGKPKGVCLRHHNLSNFLMAMDQVIGLTPTDRLLAVTTISFDIAALELYQPLVNGAQVTLASRELATDGPALAQVLQTAGITAMQATPATWQMLLTTGWTGNGELTLLCGGEALPRDLADQLLSRCRTLWNVYGPTETTIWSTCTQVQANTEAVPIGRPIANTQTYILDAYLQPVPIGVAGELHIGGEGVAQGYWQRPDLTQARFIPNPCGTHAAERLYKTGDLARYLPNGNIEYLGRLDFQVKLRGFRIELGEIESAISQHPNIRETVVIVREDIPGDKRLVAYGVLAPGKTLSLGDLRPWLKATLPDYMVPSALVILDALPLTPSGKVDRKILPTPEVTAQAAAAFVPPEGAVEQTLARIWAEVLGVPQVGRYDNFFDLGGHSLLAVQIVVQLQQVFAINLRMPALFEHPTVATLATYIETIRWAAPPPTTAMTTDDADFEEGEL